MSDVARAEASGKIILIGEHVVVYGATAIAAGIERGATASASRRSEKEQSTLELGDACVSSGDPCSELARALAALLDAAPLGAPVRVTAASELPPGGGLGSSA